MPVIVDYGVGNLFSLQSSFAFIGAEAQVSGDAGVIRGADRIVLPGVGAFADASRKLRESGLDAVLREQAARGTPIMGICLGMQLLFDESLEYGRHKGLGLIDGTVRPIEEVIDPALKVPHIGWNALRLVGEKHPIFRYIEDGDHVYFVHSYYAADCGDALIADTEYSAPLTAAVAKGNVCGCQFHPEKSGEVGLNILRGFCDWEVERP
ncbi:MAG: imidazole glycerol phosphate synthase subunit HisH [Oscillospiraceae bacterium]|nr:imidazole glycerol phosphate synthase subunit HisH [Oscillospiraceae bacterium]